MIMKKIAFVFSNILPMPDVKGGATETLIQQLIDDNEKYQDYHFTIYSAYDEDARVASIKYQYSSFVYPNADSTLIDRIKFQFYRLRRKISKSYVPDRYLNSVIKHCGRSDYDAIIVESAFWFVPFIKKRTHSKVYVHLHFDPTTVKGTYAKKALEACDGVICVSRFIQERINTISPKIPTCILPNAVDPRVFNYVGYEIQEQTIRKQYGIKFDDIVLVYSGRLIEVKGVKELVLSFLKAKERNNNLKLFLVGSAEYGKTITDSFYDTLVTMIGEELSKSVFLTGYINHKDIPVYYEMADIVVLPTTDVEEAAPLSALEALSSNCYFIGSDSGGIPEMADCNYRTIVKRGERYVNDLADAIVDSSLMIGKKDLNCDSVGRKYIISNRNTENYYYLFSKLDYTN